MIFHSAMDGEDLYLIVDMDRSTGGLLVFWGPNESGYWTNIDSAGRYPKSLAMKIVESARPYEKNFILSVNDAVQISRQVVPIEKAKVLMLSKYNFRVGVD